METLNIKDVISQAKNQGVVLYNAKRLEGLDISMQDFKELFLIRAQQAMGKRSNFIRFQVDEHNRAILNIMYHYIAKPEKCNINPRIGIIMQGDWGCGKSILIEAFCHVYNDLICKNKEIKIIHALELVEDLTINGITPYSRIPLCIQDMGKEKMEVKRYGTTLNPITELLAVRAEYGSMTFGTTNLPFDDFAKAYQTYIAKRILEHVNWVRLPGPNRRPDYTLK